MLRVILANTTSEANAFAREQGWRPGSYRYATRAASIRGVREVETHELPSFDRRMDRHAVLAELRYNRGPHFVHEGWSWAPMRVGPAQPELPFDTSTTTSTSIPRTSAPEPKPVVVKKARASTKPKPSAVLEDL